MSKRINISPLQFPWQTLDPFLFCAYHKDAYPRGTKQLGPDASLAGRTIGQDFNGKDGWNMYHGQTVPGFPAHPHYGFETVTIAKEGMVDHSDSLGAAGRFGNGDVQWMTAGKGVQHAEMFPLLHQDKPNPFELFQIWLNLPKNKKQAAPHFGMLWDEQIPKVNTDESAKIAVIAGRYGDTSAPVKAPDSWAANLVNNVNILTIALAPEAEWVWKETAKGTNRSLYFYRGSMLFVENETITPNAVIVAGDEKEFVVKNGEEKAYLLLLEGKPINEPVVQYGPFVVNTSQEVQQVMREFQRTQFGGWPWPSYDHVHDGALSRFALHADGRKETP